MLYSLALITRLIKINYTYMQCLLPAYNKRRTRKRKREIGQLCGALPECEARASR